MRQANDSRVQWFSLIRTLGVCLVLGYHLFSDQLRGGFIGVDVFFTFSGYLVTALAIRQYARSSKFSLSDFYVKRIKRIVPPLLLAILFTLPFALLLDPEFLVQLGRRLSASLSFVRNYYEIAKGGSYEDNLFPKLFVHTWSLSVEMQLYLVWGAIIALISLAVKRGGKDYRMMKTATLVVSVAFATVTYLNMQSMFTPDADPAAAYYATHSHSFPFFIGAATASLIGVERTKSFKRFALTAGKPIGIIGAVVSTVALVVLSQNLAYAEEFTYRAGFLMASLLAALLIVSARILHDAFPTTSEPRVLTIISDLSYYIYLLHWPIYIILYNTTGAFGVTGDSAPIVLGLVVIALTFVASSLCMKTIEPFVMGKKTILKGVGSALMGSLMAALAAICVFTAASAPKVSPMSVQFANEFLLGDLRALAHLAENTTVASTTNNVQGTIPEIDKNEPTETIIPNQTGEPYANENESSSESGEPTAQNTEALEIAVLPDVTEPPPIATPEPIPTPEPEPTPVRAIPIGKVTLIGDSVSLGAKSALETGIPNCIVDAATSRNLIQGPDIFRDYINKGKMGDTVVVTLGTNGSRYFETLITEMIELLPEGRRLVFITPYDGRATSSWASYKTCQYLRSIANSYDYVTIGDWAKAIESHPNWLTSDKVHLRNSSAINEYVRVVKAALEVAALKPVKGGDAKAAERAQRLEQNAGETAALGFTADVLVDTKTQGVVMTNGNPLNLRYDANAGSSLIGQIPFSAVVECYETTKSNVWLYIIYGEMRGYVSSVYIER